MKTCPKCQATVSDTAKFCVKCGFNIKKYEEENAQKEYFCAECGTKFSGGTFCPECGYDVSKDLTAELSGSVSQAEATAVGFDFGTISDMATDQLFEKEGFIVENSVLMSYKGNKRSIVIHDVEEIYDGAFENNELITFVEIKEGVKIIGKRAFANCKSLVKINIPSSVEKIYDDAFENVKLDTLILKKIDNCFIKQCLSSVAKQYFSNIKIDGYVSENDDAMIINIKEIEVFAKERQEAEKKHKEEAEAMRKAEAEAKRKAEIEAKWSVGGSPIFGSYKVNLSKDKEPLEWLVLKREGNKSLIITKKAVDFAVFNGEVPTRWHNSYIRKWLNSSFFKRAFTNEEQTRILKTDINGYQSNVFILSLEEAKKYLKKEEMRCKRVYYSDWWLRGGENYVYDVNIVTKTGSVSTAYVNSANIGVRPAMWVDLGFLNEK